MLSNDQFNGVFELTGAYFNFRSVRALRRDQSIAGVCWTPWVWFTGWGVWNLYYYPSLTQYYSLAGGAVMVSVNLVWLGHVAYYNREKLWEALKTSRRSVVASVLTSLKTFSRRSTGLVSSPISVVGNMISRN